MQHVEYAACDARIEFKLANLRELQKDFAQPQEDVRLGKSKYHVEYAAEDLKWAVTTAIVVLFIQAVDPCALSSRSWYIGGRGMC